VFPGTRLFAVPLPSTNEVVLTPIDPDTWGDLWRLEATVSDRPGSAKSLVETLVTNDVNVLVHEGVSESAEKGKTVHRILEILDLQKYANDVDGTSEQRNSGGKALLKPNGLVNTLIGHSADCLLQRHEFDGWEMRFNRMEFFFRNKEDRFNAVELSLNFDNEVQVPAGVFRELDFAGDAKAPLPLHIISDTEQKYVKLRVLSPKRYYLLCEIEHAERVGAIDEFMGVFRAHDANIIDSYSRLKSIAHSALFYALAEFPSRMSSRQVQAVVGDLVKSSPTRSVVLKGAVGDGPLLEKLKLPTGVSTPAKPALRSTLRSGDVDVGHRDEGDVAKGAGEPFALGQPYYADRSGASSWTLNTAQVFMAIPFSAGYTDFYEEFIATPVREAGLAPLRIDQMPTEAKRRHIVDKIEESIARSLFVIADVTDWNPNVVYEVGLACGISKPIVLLCDERNFDANQIPFDFQSYELIKYSLYKTGELRARLSKHLSELREDAERRFREKQAAT